MGRRRNPPNPKTEAGRILGEAMLRLMPARFPHHRTETQQIEQLAQRSGVAKETIRLMVRGEGNPDLSKIQLVANALHATVGELFTERNGAGIAPQPSRDDPGEGELQSGRSR